MTISKPSSRRQDSNSTKGWITALAAMLIAGLALLAIPGSAAAGTVSRDGSTLRYDAVAGDEDYVEYSLKNGKLRLESGTSRPAADEDPPLDIDPGSGCTRDLNDVDEPDVDTAICDLPSQIVVELGDQRDFWQPYFENGDVPVPMQVNGGDGEDYIETSVANDVIEGGTAADSYFGQGLYGGDGNDTITDASAESAHIEGGDGADTVTSSSAEASLSGGPGNDTVTTTGSESWLYGDDGNDVINGGPGADFLEGDSYSSSAPGNDLINAGGGDDKIYGGPGDDVLNGEDGSDSLRGDDRTADLENPSGNDTLNGGPGNDSMEPLITATFPLFGGADTYIGGDGYDSLSYFWGSGPVSITLDGTANDGASGEGDNIGSDVEELGGSSASDTLVGDNGAQVLSGFEGDDEIQGLGGDDELYGGDFVDELDGGAGDDLIYGGTLSDVLIGGPGQDQLLADDVCTYYGPFDCFAGENDEIYANDGERDIVFCHGPYGPEIPADGAVVDELDDVKSSGLGACAEIVLDKGGVLDGEKACEKAKSKVRLATSKLKKAQTKVKKAKGKAKVKKAKKKVKRAKKVLKAAKKDQRKKCN